MAIITVSNTKNGSKAIDYAIQDKKKQSEIPRFLIKSSQFLLPSHEKEMMQSVWNKFNKNHKKIEMYRVIQSFSQDDLSWENEDDIKKANEIGLELAERIYPDRQVLVVTQADGNGKKLHNHILVNSIDATTGRSLRDKETNWSYISQISDEIVRSHNLSVIDKDKRKSDYKYTHKEASMVLRNADVWKENLRNTIEGVINSPDVFSYKDVEYALEELGVTMKKRGKTLTYSFDVEIKGEMKTKKIRGSKLGSLYELGGIEDGIKNRIREEQSAKILERIESTEREFEEFAIGIRKNSRTPDKKHRHIKNNESTSDRNGLRPGENLSGIDDIVRRSEEIIRNIEREQERELERKSRKNILSHGELRKGNKQNSSNTWDNSYKNSKPKPKPKPKPNKRNIVETDEIEF